MDSYLNIFTLFATLLFLFESSAIVIQTKQGSLKGLVLQSRNGTKYHSFMGIPFAKPPVGELRFEPPQPPDSWTGTRDATKPPSKCIQPSNFVDKTGQQIGQEDCLYLNVYTPANVKVQAKLPVMVWIHGGGFVSGEGIFDDPQYFLDYDIVVVNFNYRLGSLGFLSAGDEILPGNNGMKDQVAALKWVQENIADFGGDSQQVTIAGVSAGAVSVHLLMHSPLSEGLFHRAISQSGSALAAWAQTPPLMARQKLTAFGILAGCSTESTRVLVDCLKNISAREILQIQQKFYIWNEEPLNPFPCVIEGANVQGAFLKQNPWRQKVLHEVPWIVGFTSGEGAFKVAKFCSDNGKQLNELDTNYKRLLPMILSYLNWLKKDDIDKVTESLKTFYFGDKKIGMETIHEILDLFSDGFFIYDCMEAAYRHTNKTYLYYYVHKGEKSLSKLFGNCPIDLGVSHGDDMFSIFPLPFVPGKLSSADLQVSNRIVKYWINFAYTGNPTTDNSWLILELKKELNYLHIQTQEDDMKTGLLPDRYSFWKNLRAHPSDIVADAAVLRDELR